MTKTLQRTPALGTPSTQVLEDGNGLVKVRIIYGNFDETRDVPDGTTVGQIRVELGEVANIPENAPASLGGAVVADSTPITRQGGQEQSLEYAHQTGERG